MIKTSHGSLGKVIHITVTDTLQLYHFSIISKISKLCNFLSHFHFNQEKRKKEREAEERRMAEQRAAEDSRRKSEEVGFLSIIW